MTLLAPIIAAAETFKAIRRDIHAHPELCYTEHRTAQIVIENSTWKFHVGISIEATESQNITLL